MARIVCESILEHFNLISEIYKAITKIPDEYWRGGDIEYLIPSRQIFHVNKSPVYSSWGMR